MVTTGVEAPRQQDGRDVSNQFRGARPAADRSIRGALRALLSHLAAPVPQHYDEEIVLSVELDGMRYTLIHQRAPDHRRTVALSAREQEIARLISAGHTNKTVAAVLEISLWTVDTHIRRIFAKLGVRSRSAMVARLAEHGLLAGTPDTSGHGNPRSSTVNRRKYMH